MELNNEMIQCIDNFKDCGNWVGSIDECIIEEIRQNSPFNQQGITRN